MVLAPAQPPLGIRTPYDAPFGPIGLGRGPVVFWSLFCSIPHLYVLHLLRI